MSHVSPAGVVYDTPTPPTANTLSDVIVDPKIRAVIYTTYVIALVIVGGIAAVFLSLQVAFPAWLIGAQAVITYLGIPVGSFAVVNLKRSNP